MSTLENCVEVPDKVPTTKQESVAGATPDLNFTTLCRGYRRNFHDGC